MTINSAETRRGVDGLGRQFGHGLVIGEINASSKRKKGQELDHLNERFITPCQRVVTFSYREPPARR
jgi:hypothetical protein